jgi:UDP-glucose 4-epimerase
MPRVLVTGGAGFIGSHLTDRLLAEGHEVAVLDDLSTGLRANVADGVRFHEGDLCDVNSLRRLLREFRPELIFHLAAQMDVRRSTREPEFDARVNVLGGLGLLREAIGAGVRRVVYASTGGAVYGDVDPAVLPVRETEVPFPISEYGASKLSLEHYLSVYQSRGDIEYVALRFPNVYGPRQRPDGEAGVVAIFSGRMLRGEEVFIFGDGTKTRDYVYVSDVVEANVRAAGGPSGIVANLGWGREVADIEIFRAVAAATGYDRPPTFAPARPGEVARICLDAGLARDTWGWCPTVPLAAGVRRVVEHVGANGLVRGAAR